MPSSWADNEIDAIVKDYFSMLKSEIKGEFYNKSVHRRNLITQLNNRSEGSIERKHQNISAVLIHMGLPYISGYKPLRNYQRETFPDIIQQSLSYDSELLTLIENDITAGVVLPPVDNILSILEGPPEPFLKVGKAVFQRGLYYNGKTDYLAREAMNSALGAAGEQLIMLYEKTRLMKIGRDHLADRVERVSETRGDSEGYDILSFEKTGTDRYIEVKTTKYGKEIPFYVSSNERSFSGLNREKYFLYRLFHFRKAPKLYMLQGDLGENFQLTPTMFRAEIRRGIFP